MLDGRKVAGAAQRRTKNGLLQQGSIQGIELDQLFANRFAAKLSSQFQLQRLDPVVIARATRIAEQKYATDAWLHKR